MHLQLFSIFTKYTYYWPVITFTTVFPSSALVLPCSLNKQNLFYSRKSFLKKRVMCFQIFTDVLLGMEFKMHVLVIINSSLTLLKIQKLQALFTELLNNYSGARLRSMCVLRSQPLDMILYSELPSLSLKHAQASLDIAMEHTSVNTVTGPSTKPSSLTVKLIDLLFMVRKRGRNNNFICIQ